MSDFSHIDIIASTEISNIILPIILIHDKDKNVSFRRFFDISLSPKSKSVNSMVFVKINILKSYSILYTISKLLHSLASNHPMLTYSISTRSNCYKIKESNIEELFDILKTHNEIQLSRYPF